MSADPLRSMLAKQEARAKRDAAESRRAKQVKSKQAVNVAAMHSMFRTMDPVKMEWARGDREFLDREAEYERINCDQRDDTCTTGECTRRGDLFLCPVHAAMYPVNVGRIEGEVRCECGGFRPIGDECYEPCSY